MFKKLLSTVAVAALTAAGPANAADPGGDYRKVSTLVELPEFIPGMGTLYVQPDTLPAGPFLAYDADDKLVSTIYMVPLASMQDEKKYPGLAVGKENVKKVDMYYNAGHPGVDEPHYHIVLWHVTPETAKLEQ